MKCHQLTFLAFALLLAFTPSCFAPPPLVSGDVPTADKQSFEWYPGLSYQKSESGKSSRLLPAMELVYGLSDRQEINFVTSGLSQDGHFGISDSVVGTKYVFLKEAEKHPGIAGSFELKTPTGDPARGLGSGEFDYDLLLRAQKTWGRFTAIGNVGYTFVTDSKFGGVTTKFENTWFVASAQEFQLTKKNMLFSEIYLVSRETRSDPNLIAVNVGFERKLRDNLAVHAAIGKSVRGGPNLHAYVGLRLDFDAPWKQKE